MSSVREIDNDLPRTVGGALHCSFLLNARHFPPPFAYFPPSNQPPSSRFLFSVLKDVANYATVLQIKLQLKQKQETGVWS